MVNLIKTGVGANITQVTEAANHVTITIPAGKGGILRAIELSVFNTLETVVDSGGLCIIRDPSADWSPLELMSPVGTVVTAGGGEQEVRRYPIEKELPGNSTVYVNYYPYDNQTQHLEVTLEWEPTEKKPTMETFCLYLYPLKAAGVTSTARARIGDRGVAGALSNIQIPGGKGGTAKAILAQSFPTGETVVVGGGLVELIADAYDNLPCDFYTNAFSVVGAAGGAQIKQDVKPYFAPVMQNSNYQAWLTPRDDQNQTMAVGLMWERPYGTRKA